MKTRKTILATLALGTAAAAVYFLRQQSLRHGATDDELYARFPGDDLVPQPNLMSNRAISIAATPGEIWPWIAQLGQGRGGFYSYEALENLMGCEIDNADEIVEEWQHLAVGDKVFLAPGVGLDVAEVIPNQALVLHGAVDPNDQDVDEVMPPYDFSWAFILVPDGDNTRLICRERYGYHSSWVRFMIEPVSMVSYAMTERMLRGIRDRAEAVALSGITLG